MKDYSNERIDGMKLALSSDIKSIDTSAAELLGVSITELMGRSGRAVANAVRKACPSGYVVIFAGSGNNGGDGYALACEICRSHRVRVYDVFSAGQRSEEGKHYLNLCKELGGEILPLTSAESVRSDIESSDVVVDAVFGTGFHGTLPHIVQELADVINSVKGPMKIAVDVPIGVNADDGSISPHALFVDTTVVLSCMKTGLLSYPAKKVVGEIILDNIGIPNDIIEQNIAFENYYFDSSLAKEALPRRFDDSNKGDYGKALLITGSEKYIGAGFLSIGAALRGGCGYVVHVCGKEERSSYCSKFPEVIYESSYCNGKYDVAGITELSKKCSATLVGCGCGMSENLAELVSSLIEAECDSPLILDADALNSLAFYKSKDVLKLAKRKVILTPHPRELSRLARIPTELINATRIDTAKRFAKEHRVILVLKGAATLVTDGETLYINSSGSSALAKAGSGDVLAGLIASVLSYSRDPLLATALAVYLHGAAGDALSSSQSSYGVIPSDLPMAIARVTSEIERSQKNK